MRRSRLPLLACTSVLVLTSWAAVNANAFTAAISPGARSLYLQVGAGETHGGTIYDNSGTAGNNGTINSVYTTVAANSIGAGSQTMGTDSTTTQSSYDGYTFCTITPSAGQMYVGGFYRTLGSAANATLSVSTPPSLLNATSNTLPFNSVSWTSVGTNDTGSTIAAGTFAGGTTQTLLSVTTNTWFESCLLFSYANAQYAPAGTFAGRATYTLIAP